MHPPLAKVSICVLILHPRQAHSEFQCSLAEVLAAQRKEVDMELSYMWGCPKLTKCIKVNEQAFDVDPKLLFALQVLRHGDRAGGYGLMQSVSSKLISWSVHSEWQSWVVCIGGYRGFWRGWDTKPEKAQSCWMTYRCIESQVFKFERRGKVDRHRVLGASLAAILASCMDCARESFGVCLLCCAAQGPRSQSLLHNPIDKCTLGH